MNRFTFLPALFLALAGCVSSSTVGFVDGHVLPPRFAGYSHRAWIEGRTLVIEVDQIPGLNVGLIRYRIVDGNIHLCPVRASSGGPGRDVFRIDLSSEDLRPDWKNRIYWLTYEGFYPIGNRAFWHAKDRKPSERVRVVLTRSDGKRE